MQIEMQIHMPIYRGDSICMKLAILYLSQEQPGLSTRVPGYDEPSGYIASQHRQLPPKQGHNTVPRMVVNVLYGTQSQHGHTCVIHHATFTKPAESTAQSSTRSATHVHAVRH